MTKRLWLELKALGWVATISLLACILFATLIYFTGIQENTMKPLGTIILIISVLAGGIYAGKSYASRGLIHGSRIGLISFIIILIASILSNSAPINIKNFIATMIVCLLSGGIGGIIGIGANEMKTKS